MSHNERILSDDGNFQPFPKRHLDKAVERGERQPIPEPSIDPLIESGAKGKAELAAKQASQKIAQKKADLNKAK